jgi:hypothetical protein
MPESEPFAQADISPAAPCQLDAPAPPSPREKAPAAFKLRGDVGSIPGPTGPGSALEVWPWTFGFGTSWLNSSNESAGNPPHFMQASPGGRQALVERSWPAVGLDPACASVVSGPGGHRSAAATRRAGERESESRDSGATMGGGGGPRVPAGAA